MPKHFIPKADSSREFDTAPDKAVARISELIYGLDRSIPWAVTIERHRKKRSLDQNALYWKWISIIADECGDAKDDTHETMMRKFLEPRVSRCYGEEHLVWSTKDQPVDQMAAYMKKVDAFAGSFLAIKLPHPEDKHLESMA